MFPIDGAVATALADREPAPQPESPMSKHILSPPNRRRFLRRLALVPVLTSALAPGMGQVRPPGSLHLACNEYPWSVYFGRDNRRFGEDLDAHLREVAASGLDGFEPFGASPDPIRRMAQSLQKQGLAMRSLYVNSTLHDDEQTDRSVAEVLAIAKVARAAGTRIIVTNPAPLQWGGQESKSDTQLRAQARALNTLGAQLADLDLKLAYHNHDIELRHAAREFHHMMVGTDPRHVHLCLDAHWIYRGAGNSSVALFDVLELYAPRIVELHVRQSRNGIWSETFTGTGDIDYPRLVAVLVRRGIRPLVVLEQAVEAGSPHTLKALEAHRQSVLEARKTFAPLAAL